MSIKIISRIEEFEGSSNVGVRGKCTAPMRGAIQGSRRRALPVMVNTQMNGDNGKGDKKYEIE